MSPPPVVAPGTPAPTAPPAGNPAPPDLPPFAVPPLASPDDSTVALDPSDPTFADLREYLLWPDTHPRPTQVGPGPFPDTSRPRLSAASTVSFTEAGQSTVRTARGLLCFADRQRVVSATLRAVDPQDGMTRPAPPDPSLWRQLIVSKFAPPEKREDGRGTYFWFSVKEQCDALAEVIFPAGVPRHGLVVLTGGTNSAKSEIARGLVDHVMNDAIKEKPARRPHLVTFEDPIEKYFVAPGKVSDPSCYRAIAAVLGPATLAALPDQPASRLAPLYGLDYTPREKGKDVHDLKQAFGDALRQTPKVFFVGEVREREDWHAVLEFAGTGHLVVTTAHAGSLLEAVMKILTAVDAHTPATRRLWASKVLAVVHLKAEEPKGTMGPTDRRLLLPAVWRRTPAGLAALTAGGFGSIVPSYRRGGLPPGLSALGRRYFLDRLTHAALHGGPKYDDLAGRQAELGTIATRLDLLGE